MTHCTSLKKLTACTQTENHGNYPEVILPALQTLVLRGNASQHLRFLRAPVVCEIDMMCDDSLGELQSFAQRNRNVGRTVSSITLLADDDDEDIRLKWEPLFEMYPSVSRLHVQDKDPGRTLLVTEWLLDTLCRRLHDPLLPCCFLC